MISRSRPDSVGGGGGSSRNFPGSPEAVPIQWGGREVVAEIFRDLQKPA